ncbi:probable beta-hexosaminidase fdl [Achroia grisella]|uniref:probable beta-hexosaminidase fdl n=1 Tax=Achroia grisella TaxID=688607 RepID=UPI0027D20897|nr:probable beta-hexosaminidase fdl [Achroia grisella]
MAAFEAVSRLMIKPLGSRLSLIDFRRAALPEIRSQDDGFDPRLYRDPKCPIRPWMAYFNLLRTGFGAGVLGLPLAISQCGIILGPLMTLATGALMIYTHLTLLRCLNEISRQMRIPYISYRYGFRIALLHGPPICRFIGKRGPTIIAVMMMLSQVGICTVFVIFTTDSLRDIMDWQTSRPALLTLLLPYILLEFSMKTLKIVSYVSLFGNFLNLVGLVLIFYLIFDDPHGETIVATTEALPFLFAFGTFLFNMSAVGVVLSLDKALKYPKIMTARCGVVIIGILVPTLVSTVFGTLGYWSFGTMEENILRSLPFDNPIAMTAIGLYMIAVALAYPIQCYPGIQIILEVAKNHRLSEAPSDRTMKILEYIARPVFVCTSFTISYLIPFQGPFVAFVGSLCTTLLAIVFPAMMELCLMYPSHYGKFHIHLVKNLMIIIFGIIIWFFGVVILPLWTWDCVNDKCVPSKATERGKLQSLMTCNMLCASMQLWPQPTGTVSLSTTAVPVRVDLIELQIISYPSESVRDHLRYAFELMRNDLRILEQNTHGFQEWRSVVVRVSVNGSIDPRMRLSTDESYKLSLRPKRGPGGSLVVNILAQSFCGARHAFETFTQLIWLDPHENTLLALEAAKIEDFPKFRYRGLMLDTARNYFPVRDIIRTIDAMAACKLNTFHWRASDSQAFSIFLSSVPQLSDYGAYGKGAVYTPNDVRIIARHARLRGIRVLIEIDTPAHVGRAWSWGEYVKLGDLVHCVDADPKNSYCNEPPCGQLNPRNPHVYDLLERIYTEIIQLTGVTDLFHLGSDDVSERCWADHFNKTDSKKLWLEYIRSALQHLKNANGQLPSLTLLWTSSITEIMKSELKDYINIIGLQARTAAWAHKFVVGIRTVVSHEDAWDLNNGMGSWYGGYDGAPYNSWQRVYEYRPWGRNSAWNVEGGEATVWSSSLSVGGLDARVWPRAAALAERLWTDRAEGATRPVHARLDVHRTRLVDRGIQAAPLWSLWCTHNPYTCG